MATSTVFKNIAASNLYNLVNKTAIPAELYVGVSRTTPDADGGNFSEPVGGSYARVLITSRLEEDPANGTVTNAKKIQFPESTADWGQVTHWGLFAQATGGNSLQWNALDPHRSVELGTTLYLKPGELQLSIIDA
jgi:hypothetical protein